MTDATEPRTMTAVEWLIEVARRNERHENTDRWDMADAVAAAVEEHEPNGARAISKGDRTGLFGAIAKIWEALEDAGVHGLAIATVARYYNVATAWPPETRVEGATYEAHYELASGEWDGKRQKILTRLVQQSTRKWVGRDIVRLYKSSRKPAEATPWEERLEKRFRSVLTSRVGPDPHTPHDWKTARDVLRRLLREVEAKLTEMGT